MNGNAVTPSAAVMRHSLRLIARFVHASRCGNSAEAEAAKRELDAWDKARGFRRTARPRIYQSGEPSPRVKSRQVRFDDSGKVWRSVCREFVMGDETGPLAEDPCGRCGWRYDAHGKCGRRRGVACLEFLDPDPEATHYTGLVDGPETVCLRCHHPHHEHRLLEA